MQRGLIFMAALLLSAAPAVRAQQSDPVIQLMKEFTSADAPSGFEGPVRRLFEREMKSAGAEISTDGLGSVIARVPGAAATPRIMVDAHLDEVGLMVRSITPEGFITVQRLGGWIGTNMVDQRWTILTSNGPIPAVSGTQDAHISTPESVNWSVDPLNVFLDAGARSRADALAMGIRPGDAIAPSSPFTVLANQRYAAKAWDDRIGLLVEIEALKQLRRDGVKTPNTIFFTGTVQEEVGMRGAITAAHEIKPDVGIAIEVGIAADYPGTNASQAEEKLGEGPGVFAYDGSVIPNTKLFDLFQQTAAANHIPLQTDLVVRYGEDAAYIQRSGNGVPVINFVVPARYTHANTGIIARSDFNNAVTLLVDVLERLNASTVKGLTNFQ
ncbi:MAG: M42 family metallopeptidase [Acidobacteriota bacterium]|nr:M42 family metallopeptidase [Acidobacteriota bacterium]